MARRKDHSREELIQLAINCGRELVIAEGPSALSARNVAKLMGYTPGTLYNIFDNVDGLAAAINSTSLTHFAENLRCIIRDNAKPKKRLNKIAQAYLDFQDEEPHLWSLLFATPIEHDSESYHSAIHLVFDQVAEVMTPFSKGKKAARQNAKILWSTLHGICLLRASGKLDVSEPDSTEELVKRFLDNSFEINATTKNEKS
ncbi:MAG: TetR/AcrR family transcriptional regulator [Opitutaceae bacterium]